MRVIHKDPALFIQDDKLFDIVDKINNNIKRRNNLIHSNISPRFDLDLVRNRKSHHRKQSKYDYYFNLYCYGIHPGPALANLWMQK